MKSQPISACVCKAKIRNLGIRERVGRSAPPPALTGLRCYLDNMFPINRDIPENCVADGAYHGAWALVTKYFLCISRLVKVTKQ